MLWCAEFRIAERYVEPPLRSETIQFFLSIFMLWMQKKIYKFVVTANAVSLLYYYMGERANKFLHLSWMRYEILNPVILLMCTIIIQHSCIWMFCTRKVFNLWTFWTIKLKCWLLQNSVMWNGFVTQQQISVLVSGNIIFSGMVYSAICYRYVALNCCWKCDQKYEIFRHKRIKE